MLESTLQINQIVDLAKKNGMPSIVLTDRGNLFASLEFALAAKKQSIQPIHGAIVNVAYDIGSKHSFAEILLIAKDTIGYKNLLKLVSATFTTNDRSIANHITQDDLRQYSDGLIILSAYTEGMIGQLLLANAFDQAVKVAQELQQLVGDRFYFEIMRHGYAQEEAIERDYLEIARRLNIPLLATNKVLFSEPTMHDAHDVLLCIAEGVVREQQHRKRVSNQCYFKKPEEIASLFHDIPEAIENTVHLAMRCYVMAETREPCLSNFLNSDVSEPELLIDKAKKGLTVRFQEYAIENQQEYIERLDYELEIICKMNFAGYFLIVADFISWSKNNNIAVGPGRGSGAGSIIAWVLQITELDPIKFGLIFERFLNPDRVSMPDFDIDFCQEQRGKVINYVRSKYGDNKVGQIITFGKMQAKAVIKDVARVLGLRYAFADHLTSLVPFNAINPVTLSQAIMDVKELQQAYQGAGLYNLQGEEELIQQVLNTSLALEGLQRHISTHAAGIVIANRALIETVPVYKDAANNEMLVVQYSMKFAELAGLVKFDFLGLQTLTVITKTLEIITQQTGKVINIKHIPDNDQKTYAMLSAGLSTGVFQFESVGMKNALRKLQPDNLDDIIALGALYRPGPMDNIPTYIACKYGQQKVDYLHPLLQPILKATYGVIIYQEQVMEIAKVLAGYSLSEADLLRRAMGKKVKEEMDAQKKIFVTGAMKNGLSISQAQMIFATVAKFAGYGFNKSHASAYGIISYQTAYLKANYPAEFLVACLNLDIDNSDKINIFLQEAKIFGLNITSPDINRSDALFTIMLADDGDGEGRDSTSELGKKSIVFALGAIKNVTRVFGQQVAKVRKDCGSFSSIIDFVEKMEPRYLNKRLLENIIKAGCFDALHLNRKELLENIVKIISYGSAYHIQRSSKQCSLISVDSANANIFTTKQTRLTVSEIANMEFEALGLFINSHPLQCFTQTFAKCQIKGAAYVRDKLADGASRHKLAGIIIKKDARMSARGRFVTLLLSDPSGIFEVTIYNEEVLKSYASCLKVKEGVVIDCEILKDKGGVRITAHHFSSIGQEIQKVRYNLTLNVSSQNIELLMTLLQNKVDHAKTNSSLMLEIAAHAGFIAKVAIPAPFYLYETDLVEIEKLCTSVRENL